MEVILIEQVKKLGSIGDVVKVKGGYGRNYLIPNDKALRATKANIALFESKKSDLEKQNKEKVKEAEVLSKKVAGVIVTVVEQAGEDGRLYGSVAASNIADALIAKTKEEIDRNQVILNVPIKYIGVHAVSIDLHPEVSVEINVNIARTEADAKDAEKRFKKGEPVMEGPGAKLHQYEEVVEVVAAATKEKSKDESKGEEAA